MAISKKLFGFTPKGDQVDIYTLSNSQGSTAEIMSYGGVLVSLRVPDREGKLADVVLGFDSLEGYLGVNPYLGAIVGRFANRIENAKFELNGVEYKVAKNDGNNHLHGGIVGFDKVIWGAKIVEKDGQNSLELTYTSKDGEEGYPGNLNVKVTYTLTDDNALTIDYFAVTDKDTVINLTNHSYFNLSGQGSGNILKHKLMINADTFTEANKESIPTGKIISVKGTPMDFTELTVIGEGIDADYDQIAYAGGYDHNWVLNVSGKSPEKAAEVYDENSGRVMEVYTTKPGIQFYTANYLESSIVGKGNKPYEKRGALCLETQYFPNSIKHKNFPSPILRAGDEYKHTTIYKFSVK